MPHGHRFRHLFMHGDGSMTGWFGDPEHYDRFATRFERPLRSRIAADVAALRLPAGAHVLDVGTGPGRLPVEIARRSPQVWVTGLDVSPRMIEAAKAAIEPGQQVIAEVGDVARLPYRDGSVDLVVSTLSQHHWPDRRPRSGSWPGCSRRAAGSGSTTCAGRCGPRRSRPRSRSPGRTCGSSRSAPACSAGCSAGSPCSRPA